MFTWAFWSDAIQRSVRTFAQTLLAVLGGGALNIWAVGWHSAIGVAAGSAFLSLLMALDRNGSGATTIVEPVVIEPVAPVAMRSPRVGTCGDDLR